MTQLFLFTAHQYESHREQSLENPIPMAKILAVHPTMPKILDEVVSRVGEIHAWGMHNSRYTKAMKPDDLALCYFNNRYQYAMRIVAANYRDAELARAVWDPPHPTGPYQYMFFLTKPVKIGPTVKWNDEPRLLRNFPNGVVQVEQTRVEELIQQYKSIEAFLREVFEVDI
jgi:hypothetical protein